MLGLKISVNGKHKMTVGLDGAHFLYGFISWRRGNRDELQIETSATSPSENVDWPVIPLLPGDEVTLKLVELADASEIIPEPISRTPVHCLPLLDRSP